MGITTIKEEKVKIKKEKKEVKKDDSKKEEKKEDTKMEVEEPEEEEFEIKKKEVTIIQALKANVHYKCGLKEEILKKYVQFEEQIK